jgi:hypothetical protein
LDGAIFEEVIFAGFRAGGVAAVVEVEADAEFGDPADLDGGVSDDECVRFNRFGDDCAGADEGKFADVVAADDGGIRTDGGPAFHGSFGIIAPSVDCAAGVDDIGEDAGGAEEDIVLAGDAGINGDVVLHFHIVAEHHLGGDDDVLSEVAVFADDGAGHDVGEVPDFCAFTDGAAGVDDGGGVGVEVGHFVRDVLRLILGSFQGLWGLETLR